MEAREQGDSREHSARPAVRVLVADESTIMRAGVRSILTDACMSVVGEALSAAETIEQVVALAPELVVLGVQRDGLGYATVEAIRRTAPEVAIVVLSDDPGDLLALVHHSVSYLSRRASPEELLAAVEGALRGQSLVDRAAVAKAIEAMAGEGKGTARPADRIRSLTPRERQVLALITQGRTNRQIAEALSLSIGTVKVHVCNILTKLGVCDRVQAAVWAVQNDLGAGRA
jgi:NarL family two-component system response regulator LiaR